MIFLRLFLFFFVLGINFISLPVEAEVNKTVGVLSGVLPQQLGASRLSLTVKGRNLPRPEVAMKTNEVEFIFKDSYIPSGHWQRAYDIPLLENIDIVQSKEGLVVKLYVTTPMHLSQIKGIPPSNMFNLTLDTEDSKKREERSRELFRKKVVRKDLNDPFSMNKKISVDFRDVEIKDVFRMLGQSMGLNIVLDPSINGIPPLTMRFDGAPIKDVFGYLMRLYDMGYAKVGNTLIIGTPEAVSRATGETRTQAFDVCYADVKELPNILKGLTTIPEDKIFVDSRLKRIYAKGSQNQLADFERVLQRLDHPGKQVMLRARIIEINDDATDKLETLLNAVYNGWWLNTNGSGGSVGFIDSNQVELDEFPNDDDRPSGFEPGSGADLARIANGGLKMLDVGLNALVTNEDGKVLANPSVITLSGKKASIKLVQKLKYVSARDDAGNATYSDEEVGPKLEFTPVVGRDGIVSVELSISTGEVVSWKKGNQNEDIPQTSEREVKTSVRVRDGEPFVVGGLFKEKHSNTTTKIPLLGDIPLLGELFKTKNKKDSRSEVVMIVIPYILDVSDSSIEKWDI